MDNKPVSTDRITNAKQVLLNLPGVCAVGVTDVDAVVTLKVYFESIETLEAADLPSQIDGIPVQAVVSGRFNAN